MLKQFVKIFLLQLFNGLKWSINIFFSNKMCQMLQFILIKKAQNKNLHWQDNGLGLFVLLN